MQCAFKDEFYRTKEETWSMDSRLLVAGVLIVAIAAVGGLQATNITGFLGISENPSVEVKIDDGTSVLSYRVDIGSRESALDVLVRVATVDYKTFGELGASVTGINGIKQDESHYWLFLVNDKKPSVLCSGYYPNNDDVIIFRYITS